LLHLIGRIVLDAYQEATGQVMQFLKRKRSRGRST
jgi:hypothetical protein